MENTKDIHYNADKKHKIVDIQDITFKSQKDLLTRLSTIIAKFPEYSICYPTFHNKEKEYGIIIRVLRRLHFKLVYKKPIFEKHVSKNRRQNALSFRSISTKKEQEHCLHMYAAALKNTPFAADYLDSLYPSYYFNKYIINKDKRKNILIIVDNNIAGFVTIHIRPQKTFGYIGYILLDKKYQGQGFSYDILQKVERVLYHSGVSRWLESTDQLNTPMIRSLRRYGFKKIRHLYGYVFNPSIAFKKFLAHKKHQ